MSAEGTEGPDPERAGRVRGVEHVGLFAVFLLISLGAGYATLSRYDPRESNRDATHYFAMVEGRAIDHPHADVFGGRVLVPVLARVLRPGLVGRVGSWNETATALLIVNAVLVAATALIVRALGVRVTGRRDVGLVAALLHLVSFAVIQFHLAGMVDSSEALCLASLALVCEARRWRWLPAVVLVGALSKEAVLPLSFAFLAGWGWATRAEVDRRPAQAAVLASAALGIVAFASARRLAVGTWTFPWDTAAEMARPDLAAGLLGAFDRVTVYVFAWLLPLAVLGRRAMPRPLGAGALASGIVAIGLAALSHAGGSASRMLFDVAGPVLEVAAAVVLLDGPLGSGQRGASPRRL